MNEISIKHLSTMCRLCLVSDATMSDIFACSTKMRNQILANVIMKCAPVQITRRDGMPNFICQLCFTQLEKSHQFQMQIIESDETLRRYLCQLRASDKQIKTECSTSIEETSEDPLIYDTIANVTVKCEPLEEPHDMFDINKPMAKDDYSQISCEDKKIDIGDIKLEEDANVKWKEKEPGTFVSAEKNNGEVCLKIEFQADDVIRPEYSDGTGSASSNDDGIEINCEDITPNIDHTLRNFANPPSVNAIHDKCEENKNTSINRMKKKFYPCDVCNKSFTASARLNIHKRIHTGEKPYQCNLCNKCFSSLSSLSAHKRWHAGDKPYRCDVCNKCFTESCTLNTHKRTHTGEKPYQCDLCNRCFNHSNSLNIHKRAHKGEKPYQCDVCTKCFITSSHLNIHKRTHTGEKPYKCDMCDKCFNHSNSLNIHKRVHTGEKPYQCDVCRKYFTTSSSIKDHKRIHTGEKPYKCDMCEMCFTHSYSLTRHKATSHSLMFHH